MKQKLVLKALLIKVSSKSQPYFIIHLITFQTPQIQPTYNIQHTIPVIDFTYIDKDTNIRQEIKSKVREASETWGFFQVVNHGIPLNVLEDMKDGGLRFFEQDTEVKKEMYTRDKSGSFIYNSNFDLYNSPALSWRDTFAFHFAPNNAPKPEDLPVVCR
jgi:isopenicillin N synthase-like dioxygenase